MPLVSAAYGRALMWAEELHRDQRRKGKQVRYISHLIVHQTLWPPSSLVRSPGSCSAAPLPTCGSVDHCRTHRWLVEE